MLRARIIPCLLIHKGGLVKTTNFASPKYVGDPINAVKIFNEKEADELIVLDIDASVNCVEPNYSLIEKLAAECRMPICYGGGIKTPEQASKIIDLGVEKISISSAAILKPSLLSDISNAIGKQSVVAVLDVRKKKGLFQRGLEVSIHNGTQLVKIDLTILAKTLQDAGAGEIVINSIDRDGLMQGYDLELAQIMRENLNVPLTMLGGAGCLQDIEELIKCCGIIGAAAGSLFVFKGKYRAVLISYPTSTQKDAIHFSSNIL
ncbi:AglZ/HisF2 family acetamidino modification protein [Yersinia ruckeri]|uniref:AglZ/HisF2 family acetamidino modification protein n=1 Tax=Yersinia ruckeri TaxID=29486 RepID=UPI0020C100E2|nr:AglZ/HisF2 family acetamidino modification protein [Yersinia ruckeri]MCK8584837.1 AglZ/HisF2 family acetamidino modification protein [Yersinia ruckeri]